jgi:hypothetical protein
MRSLRRGLLASLSALTVGATLVVAGNASAAGTFNLRDYGATGNGSTNDSAAIQRAVDAAAASGGGTVRVPSGNLTVPGGNGTMSTGVPSNDPNNYNPNSIGTRPAYGWYLRNTNNLTFTNSSVRFNANDGSNLKFDRFTVERGSNSPHDFGFQSVSGYCVVNSGTPRISSSGSTRSCDPTTPPDPVTVTAEAESGTVTAPLRVLADAGASGGQYVTVAAGNNSQSSAPSNGSTVIPFTVSAAGTYKIWGRAIAPTDSDDSFWVRVDGGSWINWNDIAPGNAWHWANVESDAAGNAPVLVNLAAGAHTITFAYREDGARLDRVLITNDLNLVPTG